MKACRANDSVCCVLYDFWEQNGFERLSLQSFGCLEFYYSNKMIFENFWDSD